MPTIAFVTYSPDPAIHPSDQLIADALAARGVTVLPAAWDDPSVDWSAFDAAVIRSTWNYFDKPTEFAAWLDHIESVGLPLMNPLKACMAASRSRPTRERMKIPRPWLFSFASLISAGVHRRLGMRKE